MGHRGFVTTASELNQFVGKTGTITTCAENLLVPVTAIDARLVFGRVHVRVVAEGSPSADGAAWVDSSRITFSKEVRS